jgi:methylaspartate ammonia-lyase
MKITDVIASPGLTGFFADDQKAIKDGAVVDGFVYRGEPKTPGFNAIRQPGESVSVMLALDDGQVAYGDCATVQYAGVGGRHPAFKAGDLVEYIEGEWADWLRGISLDQFRPLAEQLDQLPIDSPAPRAIQYGISQALLDSVARARRITMAEVIAQEYGTQLSDKPVPIYAQSGDDMYLNVDKMILKRVGKLARTGRFYWIMCAGFPSGSPCWVVWIINPGCILMFMAPSARFLMEIWTG